MRLLPELLEPAELGEQVEVHRRGGHVLDVDVTGVEQLRSDMYGTIVVPA
jgi:hypothetical protein